MSTHADDNLDRDLQSRAGEAANGTREVDLVARTLEIAAATRADDRAWVLVRLAADLRALERHEDALRVLDSAWHLAPGDHAKRAMFTCAISIHCDCGNHALAEILERHFAGGEIDLKFGLASLRLYAELFELSGDDEHRARRDLYRAAVESFEAEEKSVAA